MEFSTSPATGVIRKGAWTKEEDFLLKKFVQKYGEGKWHQIPQKTGLKRCRKSCRLRWLNYLKPGIKKGQFSQDEIDLLLRLHKLLGNRWSLIAGRIPGRTANDVKNYWNTHLHKKLLPPESEDEDDHKEDEVNKTQNYTKNSIVKPRPWKLSKTAMCVSTEENETCKQNICSKENIIPYRESSLETPDKIIFADAKGIGEGTTSFSLSDYYLAEGNMSWPEEEEAVGLKPGNANDNLIPAAQDGWSELSDFYMGIWDFGIDDWKPS